MPPNFSALETIPVPGQKRYRLSRLDNLEEGYVYHILAMVSLRWDARTTDADDKGTECLLSDYLGNIVHCSAPRCVTHNTAPTLYDGQLYRITYLKAVRNAVKYRVRNDNEFILLFQPHTTVTKFETEITRFNLCPFQFVNFEEIKYVDNKYLIDIVGDLFLESELQMIPGHIEYLDCELINERGSTVHLTIWGSLALEFFAIQHRKPAGAVFIFTALNVELINGILILNTSAHTNIFTTDEYEDHMQFTEELGRSHDNRFLNYTASAASRTKIQNGRRRYRRGVDSSINQLLCWARGQRKGLPFICDVVVTDIEPITNWFYCLCPKPVCKRPLAVIDAVYWCQRCELFISDPDIRLKLRMRVHDPTGYMLITIFDDTVEKITKTTAPLLLQEAFKQQDTEVPRQIQRIVRTRQKLRIASCSYYKNMGSEEFVCTDVVEDD